jgi:isocitrate/isopropylmalate dehydrogenase
MTSAVSQPKSYRIASIPGDGIGIEVVEATIVVLKQLSKTLKTFSIDFTHIPWGTTYYKEHGRYADPDVLNILRGFDATLFGSVGAPDVPGKYISSMHTAASSQLIRLSRSYFSLGPSPCNSWSSSTIRQRQTRSHVPRHALCTTSSW